MGVFGDKGPCEELGELAIEFTSSSLIAWCGAVGVAITAAVHVSRPYNKLYVHERHITRCVNSRSVQQNKAQSMLWYIQCRCSE